MRVAVLAPPHAVSWKCGTQTEAVLDSVAASRMAIGGTKAEIFLLKFKEFINNMPESLKTAFTLRESEGKSYEEISLITETPIGTVRSRIFRARESIIDYMQKELIGNE